MFELDIDMLKEQGIQLFDTAKKTAQDIADKGKNQLELLNQQARLSKAQRQLGALVYSLHKAGEENQPLVDKYIDAVAEELFEKASRGKAMHGFTKNYVRVELSPAFAKEEYDNQLIKVRLGDFNHDKTALKAELVDSL